MPSRRTRAVLNILAFREDLGQSWVVAEPGGVYALVVPSMLSGNPLSRQSGVSAHLLDRMEADGLISLERHDVQPAYDYGKPTTGRGAHKVSLTGEGRKVGLDYGKSRRARTVSDAADV